MQKGISLFTPLLGMLFLLISAAFIVNLSHTESIKKEQDRIIAQNSAIGDLVTALRTDAIQSVIVGTRESFRQYIELGSCDYGMQIDKDLFQGNWDEIEDKFMKRTLISNEAFLNNIAYRVRNGLLTTEARLPFGNYSLYYRPGKPGVWGKLAEETLRNEKVKPYYVVDCKSEDNCKNGSFFLVINTSAAYLSEETYKELPNITISQQGRSKTEVILPRGQIKIYIPYRMFKALGMAKQYYDNIDQEEDTLFSEKLGVCDVMKCGGRQDPWDGDKTFFSATISENGKLKPSYCNSTPVRSGFAIGYTALNVDKQFSNGTELKVKGKYDSYFADHALDEFMKYSICALESNIKGDDYMGPADINEVKSEYSTFIDCNSRLPGEYYKEKGKYKTWKVNKTARETKGIFFEAKQSADLNNGLRIISFDSDKAFKSGSYSKWYSKKVCKEICLAQNPATYITMGLLPQEMISMLPTAGVNPDTIKCRLNTLESADLGTYTFCSKPFKITNTCIAIKDSKLGYSGKDKPLIYYFSLVYYPASPNAAIAEAKRMEDNVLKLGDKCNADKGCSSPGILNALYGCTNNQVTQPPGLEWIDPVYAEPNLVCTPAGNGPCDDRYITISTGEYTRCISTCKDKYSDISMSIKNDCSMGGPTCAATCENWKKDNTNTNARNDCFKCIQSCTANAMQTVNKDYKNCINNCNSSFPKWAQCPCSSLKWGDISNRTGPGCESSGIMGTGIGGGLC